MQVHCEDIWRIRQTKYIGSLLQFVRHRCDIWKRCNNTTVVALRCSFGSSQIVRKPVKKFSINVANIRIHRNSRVGGLKFVKIGYEVAKLTTHFFIIKEKV